MTKKITFQNFAGLNKIEPLMRDFFIEDIEFILGDFSTINSADWENADVIFANSTCFSTLKL